MERPKYTNDEIYSEPLGTTDLDAIVKAAAESAPENDIRNLQDTVEVNPEAPLESEEIIGLVQDGTTFTDMSHPDESSDKLDDVEKAFEAVTAPKVSLFDIKDGKAEGLEDKAIHDAANNAKSTFNLSDAEYIQLMEVLSMMRKNPKYPVYKNLPETLKAIITKAVIESGIPPQQTEMFTRLMLDEILKESGIDNELIDLERAIDEALKIPSMADLYSEHTREVMDDIIPKTIEKIKDDYPEEAAQLEAVRAAFKASYSFETAKEYYIASARLRKTVRRAESEFEHCMDKFNYINEKSNFKMNDVRTIPGILKQVLIDHPHMNAEMAGDDGISELDNRIITLNVTEIDIKKLMVLLCKHCENRNPCDVVDASYMYYMMRNIIILRHTQEAKTDFAVELINNICNLITFIRDKEGDFNESNLDKSKCNKKSNRNNGNKK